MALPNLRRFEYLTLIYPKTFQSSKTEATDELIDKNFISIPLAKDCPYHPIVQIIVEKDHETNYFLELGSLASRIRALLSSWNGSNRKKKSI